MEKVFKELIVKHLQVLLPAEASHKVSYKPNAKAVIEDITIIDVRTVIRRFSCTSVARVYGLTARHLMELISFFTTQERARLRSGLAKLSSRRDRAQLPVTIVLWIPVVSLIPPKKQNEQGIRPWLRKNLYGDLYQCSSAESVMLPQHR